DASIDRRICGTVLLRAFAAFTIALAMVGSSPHLAAAQLATSPWPKFKHDMQNTGRTTVAGPTTNHIAWTYETARVVLNSASIGGDGTVYVGNGIDPICALNPADGSQIWCTTGGGEAATSSPTIASDGTIYMGARDNKLWAVNPNGTLKWWYFIYADGDVTT